jgi:predicted dehydrogenase
MAAKRAGVATQLGTQIHADPNYRRVVEIVQSGAIGPVREVHVWIDKAWAGGRRPAGAFAPPSSMHWDLWLGPAPHRPYFPEIYHPMNWRRWWDFGSGTLGDMACHFMDLPFWALDLRHPTSIEADAEPFNPETCPHNLRVQYEFPARGDTPPVKLTWHDDTRVPPPLADLGVAPWSNGVLFIGDKGKLLADYTRYKLLPEAEFAGFVPPDPWIPDSIGHHREWIEACKTGSPTTCNFDYSGALTEAVLLGTVAYRVGHRIDWDAERFKATNCEEAGRFLRREYREGW